MRHTLRSCEAVSRRLTLTFNNISSCFLKSIFLESFNVWLSPPASHICCGRLCKSSPHGSRQAAATKRTRTMKRRRPTSHQQRGHATLQLHRLHALARHLPHQVLLLAGLCQKEHAMHLASMCSTTAAQLKPLTQSTAGSLGGCNSLQDVHAHALCCYVPAEATLSHCRHGLVSSSGCLITEHGSLRLAGRGGSVVGLCCSHCLLAQQGEWGLTALQGRCRPAHRRRRRERRRCCS